MDLIESKSNNYKTNGRHPWELTRLFQLHRFIANVKNKTNIVDIGCGDAFNIIDF